MAGEDEVEWGPAMMALDARRQAFVVALFANGGNASAAAKAAGYSDVLEGAKVRGHLLQHQPKVQAAIGEYGLGVFRLHAPRLAKELLGLATGAKNQNVRLRAILAGLAHGGMAPVVNVRHEHSHVLSYDEKLLELQRLARLVGEDPAAAVRGLPAAVVSEAEYEEVP